MPCDVEPGGEQPAPDATSQGIVQRLARATINTRLIAIVLTLAVPLNVVVAVVIWRLASEAEEAQRTSLTYAARSVANAIDAKLSKYIALGQVFSNDAALQEDDLNAFERQLRKDLSSVANAWVLVSDVEGRQFLNTGLPDGKALPPRPAEAIAAQRRSFETGSPVISDLYVLPVSRQWAASANIPVFKDGKPFRSLAFSIRADDLVDLLAAQVMPRNWIATIRDGQGRLVAHVPAHAPLVGQIVTDQVRTIMDLDGLFPVVTRNGEDLLLANAHSTLSNWTIGVGVKTAELRATVFSAIGWSIALCGAISLLSLAFAIWISRHITRPIAQLRQKSVALLADPEVRFEAGVPELSELWATLKSAAANRYRSEAKLRASEKRLSQIINTFNGYVGLLDRSGCITEANVQMLKTIGSPREHVVGRPFAEVNLWSHSPEARKEMEALIARCLAGETVRRDLQYTTLGGEVRWMAFQATPLRRADGKIDGVVPSGYNITDRKRAEEALHKSEARFRSLYEYALAGITLSDWEGRIVACNPAFCDLVGYTEDELRGKHFWLFLHPDDRDDNAAQVRGLRTGAFDSLVFENRYVHKDGTPVWVRKIISALPAQPGQAARFFMLCIGIGDRKRKEEELRQSQVRLQLALEADGAGMWEKLTETGDFVADDRALALHRLPPGKPVRRDDLLALVHPEDRPKIEQAWRDTLDTGVSFSVEFRCPQADGSMRWLHSQGKLHEIGKQRRVIGLVRDISRRKAAETDLCISQMRLQLALDAARLGKWLYDPVQLTASWDSRFKEIFGITDPNADLQAILACVLPEDSVRVCEAAAAALNPVDPKPFVGEYRIQRPDGEIRWIEIYGMATFDGAGATRCAVVMVGTAADITERKRVEEHQNLLMRELTHRTKNLLSVVQSIANQTAASTPVHFVERFSQRLQALSASLDLLVHSEWRGVEMEALVRAQLAHFGDLIGDRIIIKGPRLNVTPSAAQSIGMALHELATNAGKYGSLSNDHGSVTVDWQVDEDGQFSIGWVEHDGPRVKPPKRRGFGSVIVSAVVKASVGGEVEINYQSSGVNWRLTCAANKALNP